MRASLAILASLAVLGFVLARPSPGQDEDGATVERRASVAAVRSGLLAWAKAVSGDADLAKDLLVEANSVEADGQERDPAALHTRLEGIREKLARRRERLIFGTLAGDRDGAPASKPRLELAQIDVRSLLRGDAPPTLPSVGLPVWRGASTPSPFDPLPRGIEPGELVDIFVAAENRDFADEGGMVEVSMGRLLLRASPEKIARARDLIARLHAIVSTRIAVDVKTYRLSRDLWAELARLSPRVELSPEAEQRLAAALASAKGASLVASSSVVARDGETVEAFIGEARSYIDTVESVRRGEAASIARIATPMYTGEKIRVQPILAPGRRSALLDVSVDLAQPTGPFRREKVLGAEIDLPELAFARLATWVEVPLDRVALVSGTLEGADAQDELVSAVAVRASLVSSGEDPPDALRPAPPAVAPSELLTAPSPEVRKELAELDALLPWIGRGLAATRRSFSLTFYDVRDLIGVREARIPLPLGVVLPGQRGTQPYGDDGDDGEGAFLDPDKLEMLIKSSTGGDESWGEPASYVLHGGSIVVEKTPAVHARIVEALAALRKGHDRRVRVEAGIYRTEPGFLETLEALAAKDGLAGGALSPRAFAALDDAAAAGRATLLSAGFSVASENTHVFFEHGRERRFVAGIEAVRDGERPILGLLRTGSCVDLGVRDDPATPGGIALALRATRVAVEERRTSELPGAHVESHVLSLDSAQMNLILRAGQGYVTGASSAPGRPPVIVVVRCSPL